jgi:hypothetical protein
MVHLLDKDPKMVDVMSQRRPSNVEAMKNVHRKSVSNTGLTGASALTVRQSIVPIALVTLLFFMWGFAVSSIYPYPSSRRPSDHHHHSTASSTC